jgi:AcrR family transcriptional regulator
MKQARAAARRDQILHAAAAEFDEVGYAAASLSSIAARLGRTKGAMSYHFSSKASLAQEVAANQYEHWGEVIERVRADGYDGIDALVLLSFVVAARFRDDVVVRAGIRLQQDAGLHGVDLPTPFVGWNDLTQGLLENASDAHLPPGLDAEGVAEVMVEAFAGLEQVSYRLAHATDISDRVRRYWLLLMSSFRIDDAENRIARLSVEAERY